MAKILIVEDESAVLQQMAMVLNRAQHDVITAKDGTEALKHLGFDGAAPASLPDVVILDVMMPNVNGFHVCARMKEDPRTAKIPTIILTGYTDLRDVFEKFTNVKGYLGKPFDGKRLLTALSGVLPKPAAAAETA